MARRLAPVNALVLLLAAQSLAATSGSPMSTVDARIDASSASAAGQTANGPRAATGPAVGLGIGDFVPPASTSTMPYLGNKLQWTTFDQLTGDGTASPDGATSLQGVAGGAGMIVETGTDDIARTAASWTSTDGGFSWTEHLVSNARWFNDVVAHGGVYVTWSRDGLYSSTDGATWTRSATGPHAIGLMSLASGSRGFVAFVRNGTSTTTRVWRSTSGTTWTADPVQSVVSGFCPSSIVVTSSRIVAAGVDCRSPDTSRILVNASGRAWVRGTPPTGIRQLGGDARRSSVSYVARRFLLTGTNSTESATWVWSSVDGLAWRHVSSVARSSPWSVDHIVRIFRLGYGWLAVGDHDMPADDGQIVVWSSADLVHWQRAVPRLASTCPVTVQMIREATVLSGKLFAVGTAWSIADSCGETWMAVPGL